MLANSVRVEATHLFALCPAIRRLCEGEWCVMLCKGAVRRTSLVVRVQIDITTDHLSYTNTFRVHPALSRYFYELYRESAE